MCFDAGSYGNHTRDQACAALDTHRDAAGACDSAALLNRPLVCCSETGVTLQEQASTSAYIRSQTMHAWVAIARRLLRPAVTNRP